MFVPPLPYSLADEATKGGGIIVHTDEAKSNEFFGKMLNTKDKTVVMACYHRVHDGCIRWNEAVFVSLFHLIHFIDCTFLCQCFLASPFFVSLGRHHEPLFFREKLVTVVTSELILCPCFYFGFVITGSCVLRGGTGHACA